MHVGVKCCQHLLLAAALRTSFNEASLCLFSEVSVFWPHFLSRKLEPGLSQLETCPSSALCLASADTAR